MERCGLRVQLGSHIHTPESARECEGMSPHNPNWTFTSCVGLSMDSRIFKEKFEGSKLIGLKSSLYY
jgi:hypothetical protein